MKKLSPQIIKGTSGELNITADADGGEFNIFHTGGGAKTLALYGSAGNSLDVMLLDGDMYIKGDKAATEPLVEARAPKLDLISDIKYPMYVSHRGGKTIYPEMSMEGFRASMQDGFYPEMDISALADGTLVLLHDTTVDRTMTGVTGDVDLLTPAQWSAARIRPAIKGGKQALPVYFDQLLDELGGKVLLLPEIKPDVVPLVQDIIDAVKVRGLDRCVILQSFDYDCCVAVAAAGIEALYLFTTTPAYTPSVIKAAGINFAGPSSSVSDATIDSLTAVGITVVPYTVNVKSTATTLLGYGASGVFSDDPWTVSGRIKAQSADPFKDGVAWPGVKGFGNTYLDNPPELAGGSVNLPVMGGSAVKGVYCDWAGLINRPCRISATMNIGAYSGDQTFSQGIVLYNNTSNSEAEWRDAATTGQNGFTAVIRRNGQMQVWKYVAGAAASSIGSTSALTGTAQAAEDGKPGKVTLVVELTSTQITLSCPEKGIIGTFADTFNPSNMRLILRGPGNEPLQFSDVRVEAI